MKMTDAQEITVQDEVVVGTANTSQAAKMKIEYNRQIDAMEKMLEATGNLWCAKKARKQAKVIWPMSHLCQISYKYCSFSS